VPLRPAPDPIIRNEFCGAYHLRAALKQGDTLAAYERASRARPRHPATAYPPVPAAIRGQPPGPGLVRRHPNRRVPQGIQRRYGCPGLARGSVILIISDGWETGDAEQLGHQMARLSRVAYRIVWANPRTKSPRYRPEVSGMAAAWPYCDAVVSAHSLNAIDDLISALASSA
jgi:VWA domain containing CoxE-like protein